MARDMTSAMQTAIGAERGTLAHLFEINSSGGTLRLATTPNDVSWDSYTWQGIGGVMTFDVVVEQDDLSGQGTTLTLSGVDQTVIAVLLSNHLRGREAVVYLVHFDSNMAIIADPIEIYRGFLNGSFTVTEHRETDALGPGGVTITTRIITRLDELNQMRVTKTNLQSHRDMLRRAGLTGTDLDDDFFRLVPNLVNKPIYWGTSGPWSYSPTDHAVNTGRTAHHRG